MAKSIAFILVAFALAGCATTDNSCREGQARKTFAWDGLGRDPNEPAPPTRRKAAKDHSDIASSMASMPDDDAALAAVPKYSKEWVARYEAIEARAEAKLTRAMIICRGCLLRSDDDRNALAGSSASAFPISGDQNSPTSNH